MFNIDVHVSLGLQKFTQNKERNKYSLYKLISFTKQSAASLRSHTLVLFKSGQKQKLKNKLKNIQKQE